MFAVYSQEPGVISGLFVAGVAWPFSVVVWLSVTSGGLAFV
jgi:hypothetical protein